jgi:hypothetical protein
MISPSQDATIHPYTPMTRTPSSPSSRTSKREVPLGVLRHKSSRETTSTRWSQSYQGSISNSSAHTPAASLHKDLFGLSSISHNCRSPSFSDHKSFYFLEKSTFGFRNQSQCTISTTQTQSNPSRTSPQKQKFRSLSLSSAEDGAQESSLLFTPIYSWAIDPTLITNPSPSPVDAVPSPPPLYDDLFNSDSQLFGTMGVSTADKPSTRPAYFHPRPTSLTDSDTTSQSSHSLVNLKSTPSAAGVHAVTRVRDLRSFDPIEVNELASEERDIIRVVNPEYNQRWGQLNGRTGNLSADYVVRLRSNL